MADIVQRGLNLQVEAEDLASGTIEEVAAALEQLQARAESAFEAIAMSAEDAASSLADAAGLFAPEWESQLEGLQTVGDSAFADLEAAASAAAQQMAGSATGVADSWSAAFDTLKGSSDEALSSLDSVQGDMESTAGVAKESADEISTAYSSDSLALDSGSAALEGLQGEMQSTAGVASETAGEISGAYGGDALSLDAGVANLDSLQAGFKETARSAGSAADKISGSFATDNLGLDSAKASLSSLDGQLADAGKSAQTAAGKISYAFDTDNLGLDAAKGSLVDLQGQMDAAAATAKTDAGEISAAFGGVSTGAATAGAAGAAAGAGAAATGDEVPGIQFPEGKGKTGASKGFKLPTPSLSSALTGGITAALGLGGVDIAIQQLEGLESLKAQTGMSWQQVLTTAAAAKGIGLNQDYVQRLISRLDTHIGTITQAGVVGATAEGQMVSMGLGRGAVDPKTLKAVMAGIGAGGSGGVELALKTLGIGPTQLQGMSAAQQLALIATKLEELKQRVGGPKGETLANTVISQLFGRGTQTAHLLDSFTMATTEAVKNMPKGLAEDLQMTLGSGGKSMVDLQEQMFYLEVEMSASLMKIVPIMAKVLGEAAKHTTLLTEIALGTAGAGVLKKITDHTGLGDLLGKAAGHAGWLGKAGAVAKKAWPLAAPAAEAAGTLVAGAGGILAILNSSGSGADSPYPKGSAYPLLSSAMHQFGALPPGFTEYQKWFTQSHHLKTHGATEGQILASSPALEAAMEKWLEQTVFASPLGKDAKYARVDQGVDFSQTGAYKALRSGTVTGIGHGWGHLPGGTDKAVYEHLDKAITVNGRKYSDVYYAETNPLVHVGEHLRAGQAVSAGGAAELGFAAGTKPYAPLIGGLGKNTKPTQAGQDYLALIDAISHAKVLKGSEGGSSPIAPILEAISTDLRNANPKFAKAMDTSLLAVLKELEKYRPQLGKKTDEALTEMENYLKAGKDPFSRQGEQLMQGLLEGLKRQQPALPAEVAKTVKAMETDLRNANPKLSKAMEASLLGLVKMLDKYRPEFGKETNRALTEMENYLRAGKDPLARQGEQLMLGLLAGLKRSEPSVVAEVNRLVAQIEAEMRKATQTHSPSELTARIGDDLMGGLRLGMQRSTAQVAEAAGEAAVRVTSPLATAVGARGGGGSDEFTIILQIDGRELARTVQRRQHEQTKLIAKFN